MPRLRSEWVSCSLPEAVFGNTSADQNPRLSSVVLHGVDLNFNSHNVPNNSEPSILYPLESILLVWILYHLQKTSIFDINQHIQILLTHCHELTQILSRRNFSDKTSFIASSIHSSVFWKVFDFSLCCCTDSPRVGTLIKSYFVRIDTTVGATRF